MIAPPNNNLENAVSAIVSKNFPVAASRGNLNVPISKGASTASAAAHIGAESTDANSAPLFLMDTSLWGGSRVVID